jgi:hypothetical protein
MLSCSAAMPFIISYIKLTILRRYSNWHKILFMLFATDCSEDSEDSNIYWRLKLVVIN